MAELSKFSAENDVDGLPRVRQIHAMKQIDHDPNEFKETGLFGLSPGELGGVFAISTAIVLGKGNLPPFYFGDAVAIALIGLMLWWLLRRNKPTAHESAGQRFAFRFGKALNHVRRRLRRSA